MRSPVRHLVHAALASGLCLSLAEPATALNAPEAAVGAEGQIYLVRTGTYGELFPEQGLGDPENPALALEIVHPNQSHERLLVPDTQDDDLEDSASVLFEDDSQTLFVLWQTKLNFLHSRLNLIGYRDGQWSQTIEISGSPFGWKSEPQIAVTRDSFDTLEADDTLRTWQRTVVHLIWWEPGPVGPQALYTPVVLIDGVYTGWNPVYHLDELAAEAGAPLAEPNAALAEAPRIEAGMNGQSVVIGFVPTNGGEVVTMALELLPGEISALADAVRHQIIDVGRQVRGTGGPGALADKVRHQIIDVGARLKLHPGVSAYAATQVHDWIAASDPQRPISSIADEVRHQIIDVGAHATDRGFDRLSARTAYQVIELLSSGDVDGTGSIAPPDLIRVVKASARPAPRTGTQKHTLYLSGDGTGVVAAWPEGSTLRYRESVGDGWSEVRTLRLDAQLDLQSAQALLQRRADTRSASSN